MKPLETNRVTELHPGIFWVPAVVSTGVYLILAEGAGSQYVLQRVEPRTEERSFLSRHDGDPEPLGQTLEDLMRGGCRQAGVKASKSGRTIYFNGKALKRGHLPSANHYDLVNPSETYWVSGIKKDGLNRHWAGSGRVAIEAGVVVPTDPAQFYEQENAARNAEANRQRKGAE